MCANSINLEIKSNEVLTAPLTMAFLLSCLAFGSLLSLCCNVLHTCSMIWQSSVVFYANKIIYFPARLLRNKMNMYMLKLYQYIGVFSNKQTVPYKLFHRK